MSAALRLGLLTDLYGADVAQRVAAEVERRLIRRDPPAEAARGWDERDAWLIAYPDQFARPGEAPLRTLRTVVEAVFEPWLTGVHVLPFFPWSSDDGFAVTDPEAVDPRYGTWEDVEALARGRRLVVDAVLNHLSAGSPWFEAFLAGEPGYRGFFRTADPTLDHSATVRPRARPLLTRFTGVDGETWAWTTFSADQVDLDYRTPEVLLRILDVLFAYVGHGADVLRLDAVAFLGKREGTASIHLPETHAIVAFLRSCLQAVDPSVLLLTETNVPDAENRSYFGSPGAPEAHLVYQFPLPPLTLDALLTGDATRLRTWAAAIPPPPAGATFLNFLASHDGVGLRPAEGFLDAAGLDRLASVTTRGGGAVGRRALPDGGDAVYELNSTWFALMRAGHSKADGLRRHLAAHAIMLALRGVPALYVHSLVAGDNDTAAQSARGLNRRRFADADAFRRDIGDPSGNAGAAWRRLREMLEWRAATPAFHPDAAQRIIDTPPGVLGVERTAPGGAGRARVYVNVSGERCVVDGPEAGLREVRGGVAGERLELAPWSSVWLTGERQLRPGEE